MQRFSLQDTFLIKKFQKLDRHQDEDKRTYFEIIFIEEGKGKHFINEFIISYNAGDIFLIAPDDTHWFEINEITTFCYFQFTESLFSSKMNLPDRSYWLHRIERIIQNPNLIPGDVITADSDKELIWQIHNAIVLEYEMAKEFYKHNISNMVSTTLSIIARNITRDLKPRSVSSRKDQHTTIDDILNYIRQHVYDRDKMKVAAIAERLSMTSSGLSAYFKKKTGDSLHHYIIMYKLHLVKYRLKNTDFTVSEIAYQLGFTDESHLTRIFKKYNEMTPKQYKTKEDEVLEDDIPLTK
ncbi:AraC family transcriptional regulator [Dokdonia sp. Asnod1-B02]|jgi:AraC family L-rhamnose operon regulatory protein RhaS|uniref:AraC family transcriptional regulator n=1 Tax=Dokdonia sp. Asnod1-B02 TaxID=3160573 RepID=UPI00386392A0